MAELAALGLAAATTAGSTAPTWLPWASAAATAASTGLAYKSAQDQAKVAKVTSEYNAKELERAAAEERAAGARKAQEQRYKNEQVLSRQRAVAASSGAGTSEGEGYLDIVGDTAERGRYLSDLDISMGESAATGLNAKAAITRARGDAEATAYRNKGYAAVVSGAGDIINTGLKRMPTGGASGGSDYDDLIDFDATEGGWSRETYRVKPRSRGRYY